MWIRRTLTAAAAYALFALALGTVFFVVQHNGRSAVEDAPRALLSSAAAASTASDRVDLASYSGVFWVRYDASDQPVAGDAYLGGRAAEVPPGVLDTARHGDEDAVTWQPEPGLRFAIVAESAPHGQVVVAGQSLQRTELRATQTLVVVVLALAGGLVLVAAAVLIDWRLSLRPPSPTISS